MKLQIGVPIAFCFFRHHELRRLYKFFWGVVYSWHMCSWWVSLGRRYGLRVLDKFEIWEYKVTCFDKRSNAGGLLAEYVNMFLKLKQESSGYQSWFQSEDDKYTYIEEYRSAEGIALDKASISKNLGQRNLANMKFTLCGEMVTEPKEDSDDYSRLR